MASLQQAHQHTPTPNAHRHGHHQPFGSDMRFYQLDLAQSVASSAPDHAPSAFSTVFPSLLDPNVRRVQQQQQNVPNPLIGAGFGLNLSDVGLLHPAALLLHPHLLMLNSRIGSMAVPMDQQRQQQQPFEGPLSILGDVSKPKGTTSGAADTTTTTSVAAECSPPQMCRTSFSSGSADSEEGGGSCSASSSSSASSSTVNPTSSDDQQQHNANNSTSALIKSQNAQQKQQPKKQLVRDQAYWERRRKNNDAAKRSRDSRRKKEDEVAVRAVILEQENLRLRFEVERLRTEVASCHRIVAFGPPFGTAASKGTTLLSTSAAMANNNGLPVSSSAI